MEGPEKELSRKNRLDRINDEVEQNFWKEVWEIMQLQKAINNSRKNKKLCRKQNAIIMCYSTLPQTIFIKS